jgi:spermidine/putrescine transport system permease protein
VFLFIFAPILASIVFSFNSDRFPSIPLGSFTFHWYETAFSDPDVWDAFRTSLIVAVSAAALSTVIGFCTAYTDFRFGFRFKPAYLALALLPPTIPLVIMGLAMLAWLSNAGLSGTVTAVIISHTVLGAPFAMAVIRLRLSQMDPALEAAAWNLGASEWGAMRHVILPFCAPAVCLGPEQDRAGGDPGDPARQCGSADQRHRHGGVPDLDDAGGAGAGDGDDPD